MTKPLYKNTEALEPVQKIIMEAGAAVSDKTRTIKTSDIPEVLGAVAGIGVGGAAGLGLLSILGVSGLSAAGITSGLATPAGLPAPLMPLFQFLQFGKIGRGEYTIGEVSRIMYRQGYDFSHFLSMAVPVLMIEVIVRLCYFAKRMYEGNGLKQSIPFNTKNNKKPKLQTMLFSAHLIATAVNAGKVTVTKNPLAINYPQWTAFFKYGFQQVKWVAFEKEREMFTHVQKEIDNDWARIDSMLNATWNQVSSKEIPVL